MNNTQQSLEQIDAAIERAEKAILRSEEMRKFIQDPLFKKLIEKGYFEEEAARLVLLKADPSFQDPEKQADLDRRILGVSYFWQYVAGVLQMGYMAARDKEQHQTTREEILAEDLSSN